MDIIWDEKKNLINIMKHRISFNLAARVFTDLHRKEGYDEKHSRLEEDRTFAIGVAEGRPLFVTFTEPNPETVRIISARKATKKERRYYYGNC